MKKMYIAINKDLEGLMNNPGKIGAHTAHAIFDYVYRYLPEVDEVNKPIAYMMMDEELSRFKLDGDTIIVVKASEKDMLKWESEGYTAVRDRGLTCVEENSLTAINLGIYDKDSKEGIPKWIQKLRLL